MLTTPTPQAHLLLHYYWSKYCLPGTPIFTDRLDFTPVCTVRCTTTPACTVYSTQSQLPLRHHSSQCTACHGTAILLHQHAAAVPLPPFQDRPRKRCFHNTCFGNAASQVRLLLEGRVGLSDDPVVLLALERPAATANTPPESESIRNQFHCASVCLCVCVRVCMCVCTYSLLILASETRFKSQIYQVLPPATSPSCAPGEATRKDLNSPLNNQISTTGLHL